MGWNARNPRTKHDLSKARLRVIESSLENGQVWVPPSPAHRKTWEEEVLLDSYPSCYLFHHSCVSKFVLMSSYLNKCLCQAQIERALHDHFLFRKLTDSQCQVLLDCMQRVEVQPGDIVVRQVRFVMYSVLMYLSALIHNSLALA